MRPEVRVLILAASLALAPVLAASAAQTDDLLDRVEHGHADSNGVKIHYASLGEGAPVVLIHGFPDFWYTWRHQMEALADAGFRAVAMDLRGYNLSDQPEGVEAYDMPLLLGDVAAVIRSLGEESATVVGHDWGGAIAWQFALTRPEMTERLIILNLPHPNGWIRELATNERQRANSQYARVFREKSSDDPGVFFGLPMTPETLASWVRDEAARPHYVEAFRRSDFDAMLAYYKRNYPAEPYEEAWQQIQEDPGPRAQMPILMFHGLDDVALDRKALNDTWDWIDRDLTLVTVPGAGHFVQQDAPELVSETMLWWLKARLD